MSTDNAFAVALNGGDRVAAYLYEEHTFQYNTEKRSRCDKLWTAAYVLLAALTFAGSIPVFMRTDPNTGLYSNRFFNNSTSCDVQRYQRLAWMYADDVRDPTFMRRFKAEIAIWLPSTAGLTLLGSALYLFLFSRFPRTMLGIMTIWSLVAGSGLSALCFVRGSLPVGIALAACTAATAIFLLWVGRWAHIFSELLALAAHSLRKNPLLVPAALAIKLAGLLVLAYGFAAFFSAVNFGYVSRNWDSVRRVAVADENGFCLNADRQHIPCCVFVTHAWAYAYAAAAAVFVLWSGGLVLDLKTFTAADTLAQSYFAVAIPSAYKFSNIDVRLSDSGGMGDAVDAVAAASPPWSFYSSISTAPLPSSAAALRRALRHALTSSFGSLAAAAVLLAPLSAVRGASQALLRTRYLGRAAGCVLRPLASATEKFGRFTVPVAALTGRAFLPASRAAFELMRCSFLPLYSLWWVPVALLQVASALLAISWAGAVYEVSYSHNKEFGAVVQQVSLATAGTAFFLMLYGMLFTTGLQLDAVHSLYVCYAIDRNQQRSTHPDVHAAIRQVPGQPVQHHHSILVYGISSDTPPPDLAPPAVTARPASSGLPVAADSATGTGEAAPLPQLPGAESTSTSAAPRGPAFTAGTSSRLKRRGL